MKEFIKKFGFQPAKQSSRHVEYRGLGDLDYQAMQALKLMNELGVSYTSIEKDPRLKGFTIYF